MLEYKLVSGLSFPVLSCCCNERAIVTVWLWLDECNNDYQCKKFHLTSVIRLLDARYFGSSLWSWLLQSKM